MVTIILAARWCEARSGSSSSCSGITQKSPFDVPHVSQLSVYLRDPRLITYYRYLRMRRVGSGRVTLDSPQEANTTTVSRDQPTDFCVSFQLHLKRGSKEWRHPKDTVVLIYWCRRRAKREVLRVRHDRAPLDKAETKRSLTRSAKPGGT